MITVFRAFAAAGIITTIAVSVTYVAVKALRRRRKRPGETLEQAATRAAQEASARIGTFNECLRVLRDQSDRYFNTLVTNQFVALTEYESVLQNLSEGLRELLQQKKFKECLALAEWIMRTDGLPPAISLFEKNYLLTIESWQDKTNAMLVNCVSALNEASQQAAAAGVKRTRKRTVLDLEKIASLSK